MLLWLIFLTLSSYSQTIEKYCFQSEQKKSAVIKSLSPLLLPKDRLSSEGSCFTLTTEAHRRELLLRYVLNQDPSARIDFSSEELRRDPCKLKVEKIRQGSGQQTDLSLRQANARQERSNGSEISKIQTLGDFELTLNQSVIQGHCRAITPSRYEIKLEVRKDPKPFYPPVSPGVIVIINGNPPPPQETAKLQTTIQLNRGERIQLGSVDQSGESEKKEIDLSPRIGAGITQKNQSEEIYLSID